MGNVAIMGTTSSHGGQMVSASGNHFSTKQGAACLVGDMHSCPIQDHGTTAIVSGGAMKSSIKGKAVAINGSVAGCGAVLTGNFAADANIK